MEVYRRRQKLTILSHVFESFRAPFLDLGQRNVKEIMHYQNKANPNVFYDPVKESFPRETTSGPHQMADRIS